MWNFGKCCALGLPQTIEEESEILTISELPTYASVNEEEEIDLDLIYDELEAMKQSLLLLRSKLLVTTPEKFHVESMEEEKYDESSKPVQCQLSILKRQNCILRYQLSELAQHLYAMRKDIKDHEAWCWELLQKLPKYRKELNQFEVFKLNAIEHFGICIERWEQHKSSKISSKFFMDLINNFRVRLQNMHCGHATLRCHQQLHYDVMIELILARLLLHHLYESLLDNTNYFARRMSAKVINESQTSFVDPGSILVKSPNNSFVSYYSLYRD